MPTNRLAHERSPYLQQHAHNPVDWYPWGDEAFQKARAEDKPIFLSVGYSTCHWCHVMERESFESAEIAEVLNRSFVPIKVDREERPDVDRIYMLFVQATTGSGGWPMSVFLTPELKPFFGGTYFPPDNRYGRPGFRALLDYLAGVWVNERGKVEESGVQVLDQLRKYSDPGGQRSVIDDAVLDSAYFQFRRAFDSKRGGFGGAPKFPRPSVHNFLLRYYHRSGNEEARDMVLKTLVEMARGGMNDQLGGGFHRYSVDARWFVPHFEKMLYDQAQLAISYLEAYQITREEFFASSARDIFDYVLRDMTDSRGGFYSAEDADSVIDPAHPHEKGEGAFYVWTRREIVDLLGETEAAWFCYRFGVEETGNVDEDPHQEFTGKNILFEAHSLEETAAKFETTMEALTAAIARAVPKLLEARSRRVRPHLDDKILTAWNGLMISAFAKGGQVLGEERYRMAARKAADFIADTMWKAETGTLLRRYREGEAAIGGFLDDYAYFTQALLDLYETEFQAADMDLAAKLAERQLELFEDASGGGFYSTAEGDPSLVLRMKDDYDGAEPSGNSVAALNLLRLAEMTDRPEFRESAERALNAASPRVAGTPQALPQMLVAWLWRLGRPRQIILSGPRGGELGPMLDVVRRHFSPNQVVMLGGEGKLSQYTAIDGKAAAYVCENFACKLPVTDAGALEKLLSGE